MALSLSLGLGFARRGGISFDFYVDSVSGSDSNDGLTEDTAFATLSKAETEATSFGDGVSIGLKYGSEWRDSLDLGALDSVRIAAYGAKADGLPVVRGDDVITGEWDDSTDRADSNTNVYSLEWTWDSPTTLNPSGESAWLAFWEDGQRLQWASSVANCQATPGTWFMSGAHVALQGPGTLYVHPYGSTNPNSDGKTYEGIARCFAIGVKDSATVKNVWARRAGNNSGGINAGFAALIEECLADGSVRHQILAKSGVQRRCVGWQEFSDARLGATSILEFYTPTGAGHSCEWDRCVAVSAPGVTIKDDGVGGHTDGSSFYDLWKITDCAFQHCSAGGNDVNTVTVTRPRVVNGTISVMSEGSGGSVSVVDPYFVVNDDVDFEATIIQASYTNPIDIEGLRAYYAATRIYRAFSPGGSLSNINLSRSVFVEELDASTLSGRSRIFWLDNTADDCAELDGVIFDSSRSVNRTAAAELRGLRLTLNSLTAQNNVYWPNSADYMEVHVPGGATYDRPGDYLAAVQPGNEAGSAVMDPQLADPANGDFTAQASGLPANCGLERDPTCQNYTPIPASLSAAENWILGL